MITNNIDLNDFESRRLSPSSVLTEVNNKKRFEILCAPEELLKHELVDILLHYFTLSNYTVKIQIGEKTRQNNIVKTFLKALKLTLKEQDNKPPIQIIQEYIKDLYKNNSDQTAWVNLNRIQNIIFSSASDKYGKISKWPETIKAYFLSLKNYTPPKPYHKKTPPISMHLEIPNSEFNDSEQLMGLRYGAIWILKKLNNFKTNIRENTIVTEKLNKYRHKSVSEFDKTLLWITSSNRNSNYTAPEQEIRLFARAILDSYIKDPLLSEWQCYSFSRIKDALLKGKKVLLSTAIQKELLSRYRCNKRLISENAKAIGYGKNDLAWEPLRQFLGTAGSGNSIPKFHLWGSNLINHTNLEKLLMIWLLATERAQKTGIQQLTLDDIHFAMASNGKPKSLQISTLKLRRQKSTNQQSVNVKTQIYNRNSPLFYVYKNWHQSSLDAILFFKNFNKERKFLNAIATPMTGTIKAQHNNKPPSIYLPLQLLITPNTNWNRCFLEESQNSREAQAFLRILEKLLDPNNNKLLPAAIIGQSVVLMKEIYSNYSEETQNIESEVMGHSVTSGKNIYKFGFSNLGVEDLIAPVQAFARRVGDEKIALAEKISMKLSSKVKKISFPELEKICGLNTATKTQKDLLDILDENEQLTIAGEVSIDGDLFIIESDFTAAMMFGYIKHLESHIIEVMNSERTDTALELLVNYLYLSQAFTKLDPKIQNEGKNLSRTINFPFPPLN